MALLLLTVTNQRGCSGGVSCFLVFFGTNRNRETVKTVKTVNGDESAPTQRRRVLFFVFFVQTANRETGFELSIPYACVHIHGISTTRR